MLLALTASQLTKLVQEEKFLEPGILPNPQASRNSTRRLGFFPPPGPSLSLYTSTLDSISSVFIFLPSLRHFARICCFVGGTATHSSAILSQEEERRLVCPPSLIRGRAV